MPKIQMVNSALRMPLNALRNPLAHTFALKRISVPLSSLLTSNPLRSFLSFKSTIAMEDTDRVVTGAGIVATMTRLSCVIWSSKARTTNN